MPKFKFTLDDLNNMVVGALQGIEQPGQNGQGKSPNLLKWLKEKKEQGKVGY